MRRARPLPGYMRSAARLGVGGTTAGQKLATAIVALERASDLPAAGDKEAIIPPSRRAFVRRVPGASLWLWYTVTDTDVWLCALTDFPPP